MKKNVESLFRISLSIGIGGCFSPCRQEVSEKENLCLRGLDAEAICLEIAWFVVTGFSFLRKHRQQTECRMFKTQML